MCNPETGPGSPDYNRGVEDARQDRYEPPDGTGWDSVISGSIFGASQADQDYHDGYHTVR